MKAIVYRRNGPPDMLRCEEIESPTPGAQEVLIKVRDAAVNPLDCHLLKGGPPLMRLLMGGDKIKRPGVDGAGVVEAVGTGVTQFKPGDAVFGCCKGTFAGVWPIAEEKALAVKPEGVSFEDAAAAPIAALTALQGLRDKGKIQSGQNGLIKGASGGVGTYAVQFTRIFGAHATGVCSAPERGAGAVAGSGTDDRLCPRRFHGRLDAIRPDLRSRWKSFILEVQAGADRRKACTSRKLSSADRSRWW